MDQQEFLVRHQFQLCELCRELGEDPFSSPMQHMGDWSNNWMLRGKKVFILYKEIQLLRSIGLV
jgi:hypothetical protein